MIGRSLAALLAILFCVSIADGLLDSAERVVVESALCADQMQSERNHEGSRGGGEPCAW